MSQNVVRNTPKGVDNEKQAGTIPSAYVIKSLTIKNSKGKVVDMQTLITSFSIVEELFSPVIVFNAKVRDNINFFEDFAISGQEILNVKLEKENPKGGALRVIDLNFIVKEYPNYEKSVTSIGLQEYNFIAVSDYGYMSMLKKISRSVKGNVANNIKAVFEKDLNITKCVVIGECSSNFDGIITIQSPLKAVEWLRAKTFDSVGSPFFVYNTVASNVIIIKSLTRIVKGPLYNTYRYHQFLRNTAETPESYSEAMSKILYMKSNIKLDKLKQATEGGFASKTEVTDYAKKSFVSKIFNFAKDKDISKSRLGDTTSYGESMNFFTNGKTAKPVTLASSPDASRSVISTNSSANSSGAPNATSGPTLDNIGRAKSYLSNIQSMSHEIEVFGDFKLNPGRKIKIEVPKSANIEEYGQDINPKNLEELDESMSGEYIVAVAAHTFKEGVYKTRLKIIKDSA